MRATPLSRPPKVHVEIHTHVYSAKINMLMQYIYERVYSFFFKIALQSVTFFRLFKVSCLRQTNLQDSNLLTLHVDFLQSKRAH